MTEPIETGLWRERIEDDGICLAECCYGKQWALDALDEIDRLRASIQLAIDLMNDDENQDEMSSDAQEWCADVTSILNKVMGPILDD